ncbi:MAG: hypothetical protein ACE5DQ_03260 [Candidatus Paceibacterota bacterium]
MKNQWLVFGVVIVLLLVVGAAAFYIGKQQVTINNLQNFSPTETLSPVTATPPSPTTLPVITNAPDTPVPTSAQTTRTRDDIYQQIIAVVTSKNYAALEGYMTDIVQVRLENSGCCGPLGKVEAISQLDYLNNATGNWTFDNGNATIQALRGASQYYAMPAIVGISADEYAVSFQLDGQNNINAISISGNYNLLIL